MPNYFRAYPYEVLARNRAFATAAAARGEALGVLFVDEAMAVRALPIAESEIIYDGRDSAWRTFCTQTLAFEVPDWERETEQVRAQLGVARSPEQESSP